MGNPIYTHSVVNIRPFRVVLLDGAFSGNDVHEFPRRFERFETEVPVESVRLGLGELPGAISDEKWERFFDGCKVLL